MGFIRLFAEQQFDLPHTLPPAQALAFVQHPVRVLQRASFLQHLCLEGDLLSGELWVTVPVLGAVDLPFVSRLHRQAQGAELQPLPLERKAWVEVSGQARLSQQTHEQADEQTKAGGTLHFAFQFTSFLQAPEAQGWGGVAFEKMVRAAAERTLTRVSAALPRSIERALLEEEQNL